MVTNPPVDNKKKPKLNFTCYLLHSKSRVFK